MNDTEQRQTQRASVLLSAAVDCEGSTGNFKVRDLSSSGAGIEGELLPVKGSYLVFRRNGRAARGRVAWVRQGRCGLEFAEALDFKAALRKIPAPKPLARSMEKRPGLTSKPLSRGDRAMLERWASLGLHAIGD